MEKVIEEVQNNYVKGVVEFLRSQKNPVDVSTLPVLKKRFGEASSLLANYPDLFDLSPPWIQLKQSPKAIQPAPATAATPPPAPVTSRSIEQEEKVYIERAIVRLRLKVGSLPNLPQALKKKFGKVSVFIASHPEIFEYKEPWITLRNETAERITSHSSVNEQRKEQISTKEEQNQTGKAANNFQEMRSREVVTDQKQHDSSMHQKSIAELGSNIPSGNLSGPLVASTFPATFLDDPSSAQTGIDALIVSADNAPFTCKSWAWRSTDDGPIELKTDTKLPLFSVTLPDGSSAEKSFSCFDLEWNAEGRVCLAQLSLSEKIAVLVDPLSHAEMGHELMKESVLTVFAHADYVLMHDLRQDALKLGGEFFTTLFNRGTKLLDTQLASELISYLRVAQDKERETSIRDGLNAYLKKMGVTPFEGKNKHHRAMNANTQYWEERPLAKEKINYAASDVLLLQASIPTLLNHLRDLSLSHKIDMLEMLCAASRKRMEVSFATEGQRAISFLSSHFFTICSSELQSIYESIGPLSGEKELKNHPEDRDDEEDDADKKVTQDHLLMDLGMECDLNTLLQLLPPRFQQWREDKTHNWDEICRDLVLDCGRRPYIVTMNDHRIFLSKNETEVVSEEDIDNVVRQLGPNSFGPDNRAGIAGQLHRISAVRNKKNDIIGLTIRVGRLFHGNAFIIADLLLSTEHREHSILVLGPPGSGKTSLIREMARILALRQTVFIVDTSNEICGDGDVVHPCVGDARRMMVPRIEDQHAVMVECLQNHTPSVMIIDEIGRASEAKAAKTCKTRGVRMIASAHGDFASLMTNDEMEDLIGGKKDVTLGDETAKRNGDFKKLITSRINPPPFDIIVEVRKGDFNSVRVIKNVAKAVDLSLDGKEVVAEERMRSVTTASEQPTFYMNVSTIKSMVL